MTDVLLPHQHAATAAPATDRDEPASAPTPPIGGLRVMLLLLTAVGPTSFQIFLPSLPSLTRDFGVTPGVANLSLSLSMLGIAAATLVYGRLADAHGRRPMLLIGMGLLLGGSLACALAPTIGWLIAGRVVQAAGGAAGMVVGRAIVLDVYGQERSAKILAGLLAAMMIAPMLATPIGGFLTDRIGWRANFSAMAVLAAGMLVLVWARLPETHGGGGKVGPSHARADYATLLRSRTFAGFTIQGACAMAAFIAFTTAAPYVLTSSRGISATGVGLYFTVISVGFACGSLLASRLPDGLALSSRAIAGSAMALAAASTAFALTRGDDWSVWALIAPVVALAFATGITMPASQAGAIGAVPGLAGTASGLSGFAGTLVAAGATQAVGMLSDGTPHPVTIAMVALSAVALASALVARGSAKSARTGRS